MTLKARVWSEKGGFSHAQEIAYAKMPKIKVYSLFRESPVVVMLLELEFKVLLYFCLVLIFNIVCFILGES